MSGPHSRLAAVGGDAQAQDGSAPDVARSLEAVLYEAKRVVLGGSVGKEMPAS